MMGWWLVLLALGLNLPGFCAGQNEGEPITQFFQFGGTMDLSPVDDGERLTPAAIATWQALTASFYESALSARPDLDPPLLNPEVSIVMLFAARPSSDNSNGVLALEYKATVSLTSAATNYDPALLSLPAFRNDATVLQYVLDLRDSGFPIFQQVTSLALSVEASEALPPPTRPPVVETPRPTRQPTPAPTPRPTVPPTPPPTLGPTSATASPTIGPAVPPTVRPTIAPAVEEGVAEPTFSLTAAPALPVVTPTLAPVPTASLQTKFATTRLILVATEGIMPPEGPILERWKALTTSYLVDYIRGLDESLLQPPEGSDRPPLVIEKVIQDHQTLAPSSASKSGSGNGLRKVQEAEDLPESLGPLVLEFISKLELPPSYDAGSLVNGAFISLSRRTAYRQWLVDDVQDWEFNSFFEFLTQVVYETADEAESPSTAPDPSSPTNSIDQPLPPPKGSSVGVLAGIVAGAVVVLLMGGYVYARNQSLNGKGTGSKGGSGMGSNEATREMSPPNKNGNNDDLVWEAAEQPSRLNAEIVVQGAEDDVSTIGDPLFYGSGASVATDDKTATASIMQTETYNSLLGRQAPLNTDGEFSYSHETSIVSKSDRSEFSAFTGMSKYLQPAANRATLGMGNLLGELGLTNNHPTPKLSDETSFEKRLFPMDQNEEKDRTPLEYDEGEERSLDYSLPTALM